MDDRDEAAAEPHDTKSETGAGLEAAGVESRDAEESAPEPNVDKSTSNSLSAMGGDDEQSGAPSSAPSAITSAHSSRTPSFFEPGRPTSARSTDEATPGQSAVSLPARTCSHVREPVYVV